MPSILIVDDNLPVLDLLDKVLALERYEVVQALDGNQALGLLSEPPADLVITDIDMPGMGGIELLHRIREGYPSLSVLAMSGNFDPQQAIREGFDAFLCKPFKIGSVLEVVADLLHRKKKKILIVDDMTEMRTVVRTMVEKLGCRGIEAGNGIEAIEIMDREKIDLLISDCTMPFLNGNDLIAETQRRFPDLPVIVASASFKSEDLERLKPFGYLRKPYRLEDLRRLVSQALS
jgi:CheY-like chemotaxis protein